MKRKNLIVVKKVENKQLSANNKKIKTIYTKFKQTIKYVFKI